MKKLLLILLSGFASISTLFAAIIDESNRFHTPLCCIEHHATIFDYFSFVMQYLSSFNMRMVITFIIIAYWMFFLIDVIMLSIFVKKNFSWSFMIKEIFRIHSISYLFGTSLFFIALFVAAKSIDSEYMQKLIGSIIISMNLGLSGVVGILVIWMIIPILVFLFGKKKMIQNTFQITTKKGLFIISFSSIITVVVTIFLLTVMVWLGIKSGYSFDDIDDIFTGL